MTKPDFALDNIHRGEQYFDRSDNMEKGPARDKVLARARDYFLKGSAADSAAYVQEIIDSGLYRGEFLKQASR